MNCIPLSRGNLVRVGAMRQAFAKTDTFFGRADTSLTLSTSSRNEKWVQDGVDIDNVKSFGLDPFFPASNQVAKHPMKILKSHRGLFGVIATFFLLGFLGNDLRGVEIGPMTWTPRSDWINVKSCSAITGGPNAVGDGVHDDTAAIQSVFTYFGINKYGRIRTAYFPPGVYKITSTLTLGDSAHAVSSIQVIGCGSDTTIVWAGPSGGAMIHPSWSGHMRYIGLVWDGASLASCAYQHDCDATTGGSYETQIRHENESFKNFTVTGTYSFLDGHDNPTTGAPAAAIITGFPYGGTTADSEVYNCHFTNCSTGIYCAYGITQVFEWQVDGCEFDNCGTAFNGGSGNCYMIDNTHFQGSTFADFYGGASYRVRHCTSSGSHCFMNNVQGKMVLQDCWIDGWTNTAFAVNFVGAGESSVFDCTFTNPPVGGAPPFFSWAMALRVTSRCRIIMRRTFPRAWASPRTIRAFPTSSISFRRDCGAAWSLRQRRLS